MYTDNWTELYHHGIKGQKHGQRRYQNADGSLTPEGRVHYGVGVRRAKAVTGAGAAVAGAGLVNAGLLGMKKAAMTNELNYVNKATTVAKEAQKMGGSNSAYAAAKVWTAGRAKELTSSILALPALSSPAVVAPIAIGGAAALAGIGYIGYKKYQQYKANKGISVKHCDLSEFDEDTLCHFGIHGQKWGERRYQNKDGSLTPEGRVHYGIGQKHLTDSGKEYIAKTYGESTAKLASKLNKDGYEVDNDTGGDWLKKKVRNTSISVMVPDNMSDEDSNGVANAARHVEKNLDKIISDGLKAAKKAGQNEDFAQDMQYDDRVSVYDKDLAQVDYYSPSTTYVRSMYYDIKNKKFTGQYEGWD